MSAHLASGVRPRITVIIASSCEARRRGDIWRAVDSVLSQGGVDVDLHVVVNGTRFDKGLFDELSAHPRISVAYLQEGSYPAAVRHGRTLVTSEFFAYLDDDDEFLPDALVTRVTPLLQDDTVDFIATNGYRHSAGSEVIAYRADPAIEREPLRELLRANWMTPCGNMFRTSTVTLDYFDGRTKWYEWTLLAFRLSMHLKLRWIDTPTYRKHDTPGSLYKSPGVALGEIAAIDIMMALDPPASLRGTLARLRCSALHTASEFYRMSGEYWPAWKYHLTSLGHPYGWRFLPYTRRLLLPRSAPSQQ
jgi:glycosyltransferase involved in cell wall biosynthesis